MRYFYFLFACLFLVTTQGAARAQSVLLTDFESLSGNLNSTVNLATNQSGWRVNPTDLGRVLDTGGNPDHQLHLARGYSHLNKQALAVWINPADFSLQAGEVYYLQFDYAVGENNGGTYRTDARIRYGLAENLGVAYTELRNITSDTLSLSAGGLIVLNYAADHSIATPGATGWTTFTSTRPFVFNASSTKIAISIQGFGFGPGNAAWNENSPYTYLAIDNIRLVPGSAGGPSAPTITQEPMGSSIAEGATATLAVTAVSSDGPMRYQWYRGNSGDVTDPVAGATSASYTTDTLTVTTSYWVRIENDVDFVNSAQAVVTVVPVGNPEPPTITAQPVPETVLAGSSATLSVGASSTAGPLTYQWYAGLTGDISIPIASATDAVYITPAMTETATYWVRVSNDDGSTDSIGATVTVAVPMGPQPTTRIVDFGHDWGTGFYRDVSASTFAGVDVDGDGDATTDAARGWVFRMDVPLSPSEMTYDTQLPNARFYGGVYAAIADLADPARRTTAASEGHINQNHEFRDDWNVMSLPSVWGQPELESYEAAGLFLWKKEDFLNGGAASTVSFASPDDYIAVYISRYWGGVDWGRWVIQTDQGYFISESTFGDLTEPVFVQYDAEGNLLSEAGGGGGSNPVYKTSQTVHPTEVRWAPYTPTDTVPKMMFFDWENSPDYQFRDFTDVQSVGFLVQRDLAVGAQASLALTAKEPIAVKWNAFQVGATVGNQAPSSHLTLVPVGGSTENPDLWVSATELSYHDWLEVMRWAVSNQRARNFTDGVDRFYSAYSFYRDGALGSSEASLAAEHSPFEPVTTMSWYDALVWCNALSELEGRAPAYYLDPGYNTPMRKVFRRNLPQEHGSPDVGTVDDRPVVYWNPAADGYRLPTATEWATLAANATLDPSQAWVGSNSADKTQTVGSLTANTYGLHDMAGNVSEWVWSVSGSVFDPDVETSLTAVGGSFREGAANANQSLIPFGHRPWDGSYAIGFRPVRNGAGTLSGTSATLPERSITPDEILEAAMPMSDAALRSFAVSSLPLIEVAEAGSLAPGSTHISLLTTTPYDLEVGSFEIPYKLWIRVKQWAERTHAYRFNYGGDMGSTRHNLQLNRGPDEPVTHVSWMDAALWCNALSELMGLDPVYLDSDGNVDREVSPFRLSEYNTYGYPNLGQYHFSVRSEIDTALIGYEVRGGGQAITRLLPDPTRNGYRLPTSVEANAFSGTTLNNWEAPNKTTNQYGWFRNDPLFGGYESVIKAMPVGTKEARPETPGIHDALGNVMEWTYGGDNLFGQFRHGNSFGHTPTQYPHRSLYQREHLSDARAYVGFRVVKLQGNGIAQSPTFSPASGASFVGAGEVSLSSATTGVSFLYTLDGSDPMDPGAFESSGLITLDTVGTVTIRAVATHSILDPSAETEATFEVLPGIPPGFSSEPVDVTAGPGFSVVFGSGASGTGPLSYQWFHDDDPVPGATSATLTLASVDSSHAGNYTVTVTSPYGSATSAAATLSYVAGLTSENPVLSLAPDPVVHFALSDTTSTRNVTLRNTGLAELNWTLELPTMEATGAYTAERSSTGGGNVAWRDIVSEANGGTRWTELDNKDDASRNLPFPEDFTFTFYGNTYTAANLTSNGFLSFTSTASTFSNQMIPSSSAPANSIAWFWDDLRLDAGSQVWYRLDADGLVITFHDWRTYSYSTSRITAQVILFNDGNVSVHYHSRTGSIYSATIGLQGATSAESTAVHFNGNTALPVDGETIQFVPPAAAVSWLAQASKFSGTLSSLQQDVVSLTFNTNGLELGDYTADLNVTSNDPDQLQVDWPVELAVVEFLGPLEIDPAPLSAATVGTSYSAAFQHSGGVGEVTWSLASGNLPDGLSLALNGTISGTPTVAGNYSISVSATDADSTTVSESFSLSINPPPMPVIETVSLPAGRVMESYSTQLSGSSGLTPYSWSLSAGTLPAGLSLNPVSGDLTGMPTTDGSFSPTLRLTDAYGQSVEQTFELLITPPAALQIETAVLAQATMNIPFYYILSASGGYGSYAWSVSGILPNGMTFSNEGVLEGTTSETGNYSLTFTVDDGQSPPVQRSLFFVVSEVAEGRPAVETGGTNLHAVRYWDQSNFFNDRMFHASDWQSNWADYPFEYDARGYPINIPAGITPHAKTHLTLPGHYVLTWEGDGSSVIVNGPNVSFVSEDLSGTVKRRVYNKSTPETEEQLVRVMIQNQIPAHSIRLWTPGTAPAEGEEGEVFTASLLERLQDNMAVIRFMDWVYANSAHPTHQSWSVRRRPDYFTQQSPTSYEYMIELCNAASKDLWINVPHLADADYIQHLATLIYTGMEDGVQVIEPLSPHLKVYVEWSNEVWNSMFPQHAWALAEARTRLGIGPLDPLPDYGEVWRIIGEKHAESFKIFYDVFGTDAPQRVVRVLGTQIDAGFMATHLEGVENIAKDDPGNESDYSPDAIAIGAYFGHSLSTWITAVSDEAGNGYDLATPTDAFYELAFQRLHDYELLHLFAGRLERSYRRISGLGLEMIAYEGGQHVVGVGGEEMDDIDLTRFLTTMNRDPRMAEQMSIALDLWEVNGGKLFCVFQDVGPFGFYGSWGQREFWWQSLAEASKAAGFDQWTRRQQQSHLLTFELAEGSLGNPYPLTFDWVQLADTVTFSLYSGLLPHGLTLSSDGRIEGVAREFGDFDFTVQLADSEGKVDRRAYRLNVLPVTPSIFHAVIADVHRLDNTVTNNVYEVRSDDSRREAYFMWDLSAYTGRTITRAVLHLDRKDTTTAGQTGTMYRAVGAGLATWDERVTHLSGLPTKGSEVASFPVNVAGVRSSVDVTDWANEVAGNRRASLILNTSAHFGWHSRETASYAGALLEIESEPLELIPVTVLNWQIFHFEDPDLPDADLMADPNNNGVPNLVEFALGNDPNAAGQASGISLHPQPNGLFRVRFPLHRALTEVRTVIEGSMDLSDWSTILYDSTNQDRSQLAPDWSTMELDTELDAPHYFIRMRVELMGN